MSVNGVFGSEGYSICLMVASVLVLSGCVNAKLNLERGYLYARKTNPSRFTYTQPNSLPRSITSTDYRAIEKVIEGFKCSDDPVIVTGVFDMLGVNPETFVVLYRTAKYDFVVAKDWQGVWRLSCIALVPE